MKKSIFLSLALICSCSCSTSHRAENPITVTEDSIHLECSGKFSLKENIDFVSDDIRDIDIMNDSLFVISYNKIVYLYDFKGNQIRVVGSNGRARGEYISSGAATVYNNLIYVLCTMSLKIIVYDLDGRVVDEYGGLSNSVTDFVVMNDYIYMYGMGNKKYIQVYDIKNRVVVNEYGIFSDSDILLHFNGIIDGIGISQNSPIYVNSSTLQCYELTENQSKLMFELESSKHIVDRNVNAELLMAPPYDKAIEYADHNSVVVCVGSHGDNIYIVTENWDKEAPSEYVKKCIGVYRVNTSKNESIYSEIEYPTNGVISAYTLNDSTLYFSMTDVNGKIDVLYYKF